MRLYYCWIVLIFCLCLSACSKTKHQFGNNTVGRDPTWFPLELQEKTPLINAFTNSLVMAINKTEKMNLQISDVGWEDLLLQLQDGKLVCILSSLPLTMQNQHRYDFSDPFLLLGPVLVVRSHMNATSLADLSNKIIGVYQYDDSVLLAQEYASIIIETYQSIPKALESLAAGRVDGLLVPSLEAHSLVPHLYSGVLKIASEPLNNKGLRLITLKDHYPGLIQYFNQGLSKVKEQGQYKQLLDYYEVY